MNSVRPSSSAELSKAARRLLTVLAEPGAGASADPTRENAVILRVAKGGISLGRGTHPEAAARELVGHDLVHSSPGRGTVRHYAITEAGRLHLRRLGSVASDTSFRDQHLDVAEATIVGDDGPARVVLNAAESPLYWLRSRKGPDGEPLIDPACYEAGERLRRDLTTGGILPSVTARWDGAIGRGEGGLRDPAAATDVVIAARQRVRAALDHVGADFADLLIDLCGFLKGLEAIERERRWPPRSGKVVVRLALGRLAAHYGLETVARGPNRSGRLRTWVAESEREAPDEPGRNEICLA